MSHEEKIQSLREKIVPIFQENGVSFAGVFGSYARGDDTDQSDIDILIRTPKDRRFSFVDLIRMEDKLKQTLDRNVDLVTEGGISKYMRDGILSDLEILYGQK